MSIAKWLLARKLGGGSPFPPVIKRKTGNPIEIDDAAAAPMVKCVTEIQGYQEGSGTPSPDNIRPIVAYTEGEIEVSDGDGNTTTHTTTFPSAIYRGSEDAVNGEVDADKIKLTISSGIGLYGTFGTYDALLFYYDLPTNIATYSRALHPNDSKLISNYYNAISTDNENDMLDFEIRTNNNAQMVSNRIYIRDSRFETALAFNQYIANNPIEVVVKLATPTTSSVTPTNLPIKSLSGYNHIESTTGDMVVDYITDAYQNFVDTTESALPNTRKGGTKAMDIFMTLDEPGVDEPEEEQETKEEVTKK